VSTTHCYCRESRAGDGWHSWQEVKTFYVIDLKRTMIVRWMSPGRFAWHCRPSTMIDIDGHLLPRTVIYTNPTVAPNSHVQSIPQYRYVINFRESATELFPKNMFGEQGPWKGCHVRSGQFACPRAAPYRGTTEAVCAVLRLIWSLCFYSRATKQ
jgi:hypothetical protein